MATVELAELDELEVVDALPVPVLEPLLALAPLLVLALLAEVVADDEPPQPDSVRLTTSAKVKRRQRQEGRSTHTNNIHLISSLIVRDRGRERAFSLVIHRKEERKMKGKSEKILRKKKRVTHAPSMRGWVRVVGKLIRRVRGC